LDLRECPADRCDEYDKEVNGVKILAP
jgi:hypothetical protein